MESIALVLRRLHKYLSQKCHGVVYFTKNIIFWHPVLCLLRLKT